MSHCRATMWMPEKTFHCTMELSGVSYPYDYNGMPPSPSISSGQSLEVMLLIHHPNETKRSSKQTRQILVLSKSPAL